VSLQVLQEVTGLTLIDKLQQACRTAAHWLLLLLLLQVLQELTGLTLNDKLIVAISSITKMFVGELIETGEGGGTRCCGYAACSEETGSAAVPAYVP
jgi:hypothetical protein